jgi:hypothetical protein
MATTKKEWIDVYKRDRQRRFTNSTFSRVRGGTTKPVVIISRNGRSNLIFGRCPFCKGLTHYGVCQCCGGVRVCSKCRGVIQKNSSTLPLNYDEKRDPITHGICDSCIKSEYPDMYDRIIEKRNQRV